MCSRTPACSHGPTGYKSLLHHAAGWGEQKWEPSAKGCRHSVEGGSPQSAPAGGPGALSLGALGALSDRAWSSAGARLGAQSVG